MADTRVPELVADLEAQAVACLMENVPTLDGQTATIISKKLSQHLSCNWGGQLIYFPKNQGGKLDERDKQIYAEFNGKNHQELARKYNLAVQQIYKIVKAVEQAEALKRQQGLFDDD
ncbi:Mor transcription activator family protein [Kingella kingae]|uniref:DNA-binding protein RdgB n=2 Tax=Kingella kingae TaxID=504 RepID=F5S4C1_KINKI|nr:Mor transcription activator family protein [Kingella kingae]EGK12359.1 DNA-binding protein RdgB [Kingella kingae ATCC 23330]MBD3614227.1 transcriptional regulator [Kingella kingae]MBD3632827.1 transcriptional regulator [Kingella kingae]MBD3658873.1 transcriptional regulator [Kingella kingae]MDK4529709.1 Mor transcription activator family protein [Kingella kingae]